MWNSRFLRWTLLGVLGVVWVAQVCSSGEKKSPLTRIKAEDLCNGDCQIVGRLGKPYGEISKVRGVWETGDLSKPSPPSLRLTHIDGKQLAKDQQIVVEGIYVEWPKGKLGAEETREIGQVVEGRVFESGGYPRHEEPSKVREIRGLAPVQPLYGFAFHSFLYFIN